MKNVMASNIVPTWVNFRFTGKKSDLFAVTIPDMEGIIDFAVEKYYKQYRVYPSQGNTQKVKEEVVLLKDILDFAVPKLTPLQRRALLWGMIRNQYLFNIRHKLYERRGRNYDSIIGIAYNWLWKDYPEVTPEGSFFNEIPMGVQLSPSKEYPQYYK